MKTHIFFLPWPISFMCLYCYISVTTYFSFFTMICNFYVSLLLCNYRNILSFFRAIWIFRVSLFLFLRRLVSFMCLYCYIDVETHSSFLRWLVFPFYDDLYFSYVRLQIYENFNLITFFLLFLESPFIL